MDFRLCCVDVCVLPFVYVNGRASVCVQAKQLEAKEADLKKQDAFYREQVARLEERVRKDVFTFFYIFLFALYFCLVAQS